MVLDYNTFMKICYSLTFLRIQAILGNSKFKEISNPALTICGKIF